MVLSRLHCNAGHKPRDHGDLADGEMILVAAFILIGGQWPDSPMHQWFENLRSAGKELCCSVADGHPVADEDWRIVNEHYQVRIGDEWVNVPDQALVKEQNRTGHAMEWHSYNDGHPRIRCFMPGTMT
jgi:hypothetical protein